MGATYVRCDDGRALRRLTPKQREQILRNYYEPHHAKLTNAVDIALSTVGEASIIDCHSYPNTPLQCSLYRGDAQFDFNIGTDEFHTPQDWIDASVRFFADRGFRLGIDEPYAGSIVPIKHYHQNRHVKSMMLEINRRLYLDDSYSRGPHFSEIQRVVSDFLSMIRVLR
jgi:N-formylglutamate amidohydrolase